MAIFMNLISESNPPNTLRGCLVQGIRRAEGQLVGSLTNKTKSSLPHQYKALTSSPTYEVGVVHPMNQISGCNELQTPLGKQYTQQLLLTNEIKELSIHVGRYGTCP